MEADEKEIWNKIIWQLLNCFDSWNKSIVVTNWKGSKKQIYLANSITSLYLQFHSHSMSSNRSLSCHHSPPSSVRTNNSFPFFHGKTKSAYPAFAQFSFPCSVLQTRFSCFFLRHISLSFMAFVFCSWQSTLSVSDLISGLISSLIYISILRTLLFLLSPFLSPHLNFETTLAF